jgi:hypothetical protein
MRVDESAALVDFVRRIALPSLGLLGGQRLRPEHGVANGDVYIVMLVVEVLHEAEGETRQIALIPEGVIFGIFALFVELHRVLEEGDQVHRRTESLLVMRRVHGRELQTI